MNMRSRACAHTMATFGRPPFGERHIETRLVMARPPHRDLTKVSERCHDLAVVSACGRAARGPRVDLDGRPRWRARGAPPARLASPRLASRLRCRPRTRRGLGAAPAPGRRRTAATPTDDRAGMPRAVD